MAIPTRCGIWRRSPADRGVRHAVAVRVVDNSGMINANVASRFSQSDYIESPLFYAGDVTIPNRRTKGHTPADVALIGDIEQAFSTSSINFYREDKLAGQPFDGGGFFDCALNWEFIPNGYADWVYSSTVWRQDNSSDPYGWWAGHALLAPPLG